MSPGRAAGDGNRSCAREANPADLGRGSTRARNTCPRRVRAVASGRDALAARAGGRYLAAMSEAASSTPSPPGSGANRAADPLAVQEARLLDAAVAAAGAQGWGAGLMEAAARRAGISPAEAVLTLPGGARDLAALLSRRHDARALQRLAAVDPVGLKVRERIRRGVLARVEAAMEDEAAVRRCTAWLALPPNAPLALRLAWASADGIWRWAGDTATDENHYSKRAILSGVLVSTLAARLAGGPGRAEAALDRSLAGVMGFEKWKAALPAPAAWGLKAAAALGAWRYGRETPAAAAAPPLLIADARVSGGRDAAG